jgi:DNA-binding transcriptional regulator YdaS (Cro superfamily)
MRTARKTAAPEPAPVPYLSESEAAKRLGIDEHTLHQFALIWVAAKPEDAPASRLAEARRRVQTRECG